jgi:hypothetical protein
MRALLLGAAGLLGLAALGGVWLARRKRVGDTETNENSAADTTDGVDINTSDTGDFDVTRTTVLDGNVPLYGQSSPPWGDRVMGRNLTVRAAGCAMTSTSMAISAISGRPIDPGELDQYLDEHGGYVGDAIIWNTAAQARDLTARKVPWSIATVDTELAAGRPVVVGVDFKEGSAGGADGTDHWICLVKKGSGYYQAHDPANGKAVLLGRDGEKLVCNSGGMGRYRTTSQLVVFSAR